MSVSSSHHVSSSECIQTPGMPVASLHLALWLSTSPQLTLSSLIQLWRSQWKKTNSPECVLSRIIVNSYVVIVGNSYSLHYHSPFVIFIVVIFIRPLVNCASQLYKLYSVLVLTVESTSATVVSYELNIGVNIGSISIFVIITVIFCNVVVDDFTPLYCHHHSRRFVFMYCMELMLLLWDSVVDYDDNIITMPLR